MTTMQTILETEMQIRGTSFRQLSMECGVTDAVLQGMVEGNIPMPTHIRTAFVERVGVSPESLRFN